MSAKQTPIFIFSLPRSGSTFTQRILGSHGEITTLAEPMLLLPYLYTLRPRGVHAEYGHGVVVAALEDFIKELPAGEQDYRDEIRDFAMRLYTKASGGTTRYFLDKTPRYHVIADEIMRTFPDAKFIFLWRNPLAVASSMINTFGRGRWNLFQWKLDLYDGLANLIDTAKAQGDKAHIMRYEDLTTDPEGALRKLLGYLDLEYKPELLESFSNLELSGRMVDPTGIQAYQSISTEPLAKWKRSLANPVRKAWCKRYLKWIGAERLAYMGYDLGELQRELQAIPSGGMAAAIKDLIRMSYGAVYSRIEPCLTKGPRVMRHKRDKVS